MKTKTQLLEEIYFKHSGEIVVRQTHQLSYRLPRGFSGYKNNHLTELIREGSLEVTKIGKFEMGGTRDVTVKFAILAE